MKTLTELAESFTELASLPETTQTAIQAQIQTLNTQDARIQNLENRFKTLHETVEGLPVDQSDLLEIKGKLADLQTALNVYADLETKEDKDPFTFILETDSEGYADESWSEIVRQGQEKQLPYWQKIEEEFKNIPSPSGPGWHGSAAMPAIRILATEPDYRFKGTVYLPGRFQLDCPSRWGSILRFEGQIAESLFDELPFGRCETDAPIGIYIQASHTTNGKIVRPFEQAIRNVVIQAQNGVLPVYIAGNPDRLWIERVKILQHSGATQAIRHSKPHHIEAIEGNVWLTDAVFKDLQLEGPGGQGQHQTALFFSGSNCTVENVNAYGWSTVVTAHNDEGLNLCNIRQHPHGLDRDKMTPYCVSKSPHSDLEMEAACINSPNKGRYLDKGSTSGFNRGFYQNGERVL